MILDEPQSEKHKHEKQSVGLFGMAADYACSGRGFCAALAELGIRQQRVFSGVLVGLARGAAVNHHGRQYDH